jgi:hypothetical protein
MPTNLFTRTHVANSLKEAVWSWGGLHHLFQRMFDFWPFLDATATAVAAMVAMLETLVLRYSWW